ncbi:MAG: glutamate-5-semialdehyde dehydrogenase [Nitrososphaerota archaeon]|nr:glutamate-5-semialdehyde dehydrogenase [Nitrososphaerota archaeon]MDG7050952.1 glutamate-5-semialdehyde dehydrogenase [Nitrososphaerota archaeon]
MDELTEKATAAKRASLELGISSHTARRDALEAIAKSIRKYSREVIAANHEDVDRFKASNPGSPLLDRLFLDEFRIEEAVEGVMKVAAQPDVVGEMVECWTTDSGLNISKVRVPLGVIGVVYESRPNVTIDISALTLKSGNAVILRGGSEAIRTNTKLVKIMRNSLSGLLPVDSIGLIESTDRSTVLQMLKLNGLIDLMIPRGSAQFIEYARKNSSIPIIETGAGNNHIFVDSSADLLMANRIILNAKLQRPAVCNAVRKVLVHKKIAKKYIPMLINELRNNRVKIKGDQEVIKIDEKVEPATGADWYNEYMDLTLAIKVVDSVKDAADHINKYGTKHSDAIVTRDIESADYFTRYVDSACVYVNASTRFTDGGQFGFGAEVGISTQKLHARGPMGIKELTTTKYVIKGNGQVREGP